MVPRPLSEFHVDVIAIYLNFIVQLRLLAKLIGGELILCLCSIKAWATYKQCLKCKILITQEI